MIRGARFVGFWVLLVSSSVGCGSVKAPGDGGGAGAGGTSGSAGSTGSGGTGVGGQAGGGAGRGGAAGSADGGACAASGENCDTVACCSGFTCCVGGPVAVPDASLGPGRCYVGCPVSDRNAKRDFSPVDRDEVLAALTKLPISTWSYKTEASRARHIGPMAQDFMSAFHVGANDKTIFQIDADGVAFAAIQALDTQVKRLEQQNAELDAEIRALKSELRRPERRLPRPPRAR